MAGRIPPEFIDELVTRSDIVDLIGSRIALRKAGRDYQARCPFHEEKTPSFTVSPDKQFYHCFGCGAHGTAIGFLMEYDRLGFVEAVEELARRAGMEVPSDGSAAQSGPAHGPLYELLARAADFYRDQLRTHPHARQAVEYLKKRGLTGEIAARFGLGYAPAAGDMMMTRLGDGGSNRDRLLACGLVADRDGRWRDRFRDRIMFPIRDRRGRVIGFGGRLLGDGRPKYLNSPETVLFHKGRALYGIHEFQQAERKPSRVLVVEGYLDVIALAQLGLTHAVATLGTATTSDHIQQLTRIAPEIIFCFDGDPAGRAAAWKALETTLPMATGHQAIRFLFLPEGEDPDTLARAEGAEGFKARIDAAQSLSAFLFERLASQVDMSSIDGRARLTTLADPLIRTMPTGIYRDMITARLTSLTGMGAMRSDIPARSNQPSRHRRPGPAARPTRPSRMATAIALLLNHPELASELHTVPDDWRRSSGPGAEILAQLIETLSLHPNLSKAVLVERWREHPYFSYLQKLSVDPFIRAIPEEGVVAELVGALNRISEEVRKDDARMALNQTSPRAWSEEVRERLEREAAAARTRRRRL